MATKLVGDLRPGDMVKTLDGGAVRVVRAYHAPIIDAANGRAWMIETEDGEHIANSLDEIKLAD